MLGQQLDQLLDLGHVHFQVFVPLELGLDCHDVLGVPNLAVMHCLEILLELVKLRPQVFPLVLDTRQSLLSVVYRVDRKFTFQFFQLGLL